MTQYRVTYIASELEAEDEFEAEDVTSDEDGWLYFYDKPKPPRKIVALYNAECIVKVLATESEESAPKLSVIS